MKNLLEDPDVLRLYKSLQNKQFENIDDYLMSSPIDQDQEFPQETSKIQNPEQKMFFDGVEVQDFVGDCDYGL